MLPQSIYTMFISRELLSMEDKLLDVLFEKFIWINMGTTSNSLSRIFFYVATSFISLEWLLFRGNEIYFEWMNSNCGHNFLFRGCEFIKDSASICSIAATVYSRHRMLIQFIDGCYDIFSCDLF